MRSVLRLPSLSEALPPRRLRFRYLVLTAFVSAIGTVPTVSYVLIENDLTLPGDPRLFVSYGKALAAGGPASLLLTEVSSCVMIHCAALALTEMGMHEPKGSFIAFAHRYIHPAWAFTVGWLYTVHCFISIPRESIMAAQSMAMLNPVIDCATWLALFVLLLLAILALGTARFVQLLTLLGLLKLIIMIGLSLFAVSLSSRDGQPPEGNPFRNWHHPGSFNGGAFGTAASLVFSGTVRNGLDILSLGVRESDPSSTSYRYGCRLLVWSLAAVRTFNAVVTGMGVPFTDLRLIDATSLNTINSSPVAITLKTNRGPSLTLVFLQIGSIMTRFTAASSAIYASSRAASALAEQQQAPYALLLRHGSGRPAPCFVIAALAGLLGVIALSEYGKLVLIYAAESSGTPMLFVSLTIFIAHLKCRKELRKQRQNPVNIYHEDFIGEASSWYGAFSCCVVILSQLWTGLGPTAYGDTLSVEMAASTLRSYTYIPMTMTVYIGFKLCRRSPTAEG